MSQELNNMEIGEDGKQNLGKEFIVKYTGLHTTYDDVRQNLERAIKDIPDFTDVLKNLVFDLLHHGTYEEVAEWKKIIGLFIEFGADFESSQNGYTPLLFAQTINSGVELLQYFMNLGVDMTQVDDTQGNSLLHRAIQFCFDAQIEFLLSLNGTIVNIDCLNKKGESPLTLALKSGLNHIKYVKVLLENGADPNLPSVQDGRRPLHLAAERANLNLVRLLLEHGAFPYKKDKNGVLPSVMHFNATMKEMLEIASRRISAEFQESEQNIETAQLNKDLSCRLLEIILCVEYEQSSNEVNCLRVAYNKAVLESNFDEIRELSTKIQSHLSTRPAFFGKLCDETKLCQKVEIALRKLEKALKEIAVESMTNLQALSRVVACSALRFKLEMYLTKAEEEGHYVRAEVSEESSESLTFSLSTSTSVSEGKCPGTSDVDRSEPSPKKLKM